MHSFHTNSPLYPIISSTKCSFWGTMISGARRRSDALIGISPPCKWDQTARRAHFSSRARLRERLAIGQRSRQRGRWDPYQSPNWGLSWELRVTSGKTWSLLLTQKGERGTGMGTLTAFLTRILAHRRIPRGLTLPTI